jgi:two-component system, chemotaxis family, sensor kinase CheA
MDKQELLARLMSTFLGELEENLEILNRELLQLEKNPHQAGHEESLTKLFRAAHSLKGAARSVNQKEIESLCHVLEDKLAAVRDGHTELNAPAISGLFTDIDRIEGAAQRLKPGPETEPDARAALPFVVQRPASPHQPAAPKLVSGIVHALARTGNEAASSVSVKATVAGDEFAMVRVPAHRLDRLLAWSGELLVARRRISERTGQLANLSQMFRACRTQVHQFETARPPNSSVQQGNPATYFNTDLSNGLGRSLRQLEHQLDQLSASISSDLRVLDQAASPLEEEIRQIRMLPFAECCQGLERLLRDLSQSSGKQARLVIEGERVELDRAIIEQLRDPLRHLVRNAIGHGLEVSAERRKSLKPAKGCIKISAVTRGAHVEIAVSDDGRGLDIEAIRMRAQGRVNSDADPREIAQAIFLPGFSTAETVDQVSGRGVGLDIVKNQIEALRGNISVSWVPGGGTTFQLTVPLTLTIARALLLRAGGQIFALPDAHVRKLMRLNRAEIFCIGNQQVLVSRRGESPMIVASLRSVLGLPPPSESDGALVLILSVGEANIALIVDEFLSEQDLMIKTLGRRIPRARMISGATLLPSGEVALVLNAANLAPSALALKAKQVTTVSSQVVEDKRRKRLILADDSVTIRSLEKSILEGAGYEVTAAANGEAAWELLQAEGADLLVSDVDMPKLDGFGLTANIRASERFRGLPIVLVTSRGSDADKAKGLELGASAYLVKSAFDQDLLLRTIAQLL